MPSTLYMLKMEDCADLFIKFPHMKKQMQAQAEVKRQLHNKKIAEIEKKFPEYSLHNLN